MSKNSTQSKTQAPLIVTESQSTEPELGEYLLHVFVETTQGLSLDTPISAILSVEAFGQKSFSKVHENLAPNERSYWGEHFFLNKKFNSREELENANITISVANQEAIWKDGLIGKTSLGCLRVLTSPDQTILHKWAILTNEKKALCESMGFLRFSANMVKAGQPRTNLEVDYDPKSGQKAMTQLDLPPEIQLQKRQLIIHLYSAAGIVRMDRIGAGADPYVKANFGGLKLKSPYKKGSTSPIFATKLLLPTLYPTMVDSLELKLKDYDALGKNEHIGSLNFSLRDIESGKYSIPTWQYFFGAHEDSEDKEMKEKMNRLPEIASAYKGSLLLAIELTDPEQTLYKSKPMLADEMNLAENLLTKVKVTASVFVEYIQNLKSKGKPHRIHLNWAGDTTISKKVNYNQGVLVVMQELLIEKDFSLPTLLIESSRDDPEAAKNLAEFLPDMILSLEFEDKHLAFYRIKPNRYLLGRNDQSRSQELKLHADQAISDMREDQAGLVRLKVAVARSQQFHQRPPSWHQNPLFKKPVFTPVWIICNLFQAKDLLASDEDGTSDPVIQLYHFGSTGQSAVFPKTLNPIWNQRLLVKSYMVGDAVPSLVVNVWDKDEDWTGDRSFEFLGYSLVKLSLESLVEEGQFEKINQPKWHQVCLGKGNKAGKILMNFQIVPQALFKSYSEFIKSSNRFWKIPVPKQRHHIKISMLGLRGLESTGLLPIKQAGVKIATSSLGNVENMGNGAAFTDLIAQARTSGPNPSLGTVLSLSADLPSDVQIMPIVSCAVQERGFSLFGKSEKSIGTFALNLGMFTMVTRTKILKKLMLLREKLESEEDNRVPLIDALVAEIEGTLSLEKEVKQISHGFDIAQAAENELKIQFQRKAREIDPEILAENSETEEQTTEIVEINNTGQEDEEIEEKPVELRHGNQTTNATDEFLKELQLLRQTAAPNQNKSISKNPQNQSDYDPVFDNREYEDEKESYTQNTNDAFQIALYKKSSSPNEIAQKKSFVVAKESQVVIEDSIEGLEESIGPDWIPLGYSTKQKVNKHWRKSLTSPLESSQYMGEEMFFTVNVERGKKINLGKQNLLERIFCSKQADVGRRNVGKFRGNVEVIEDSLLKKIGDLGIEQELLDDFGLSSNVKTFKRGAVDTEMLKGANLIVRVYVIDALIDHSKDLYSENDTYIEVELNDQIKRHDRTVMDHNNPKFFATFDFEHHLPGACDLKVKFYDYDPLQSDDFIGETVIDIERRFFDQRWRSFENKPVETRPILNPLSSIPVGSVRLFVEIFDKSKPIPIPRNISPRPSQELELRVVVWEVKGVPSQDFEDVSDLFVTVGLPGYNQKMRTDTHYRAQSGYGSFNWRTKFRFVVDEYFNPGKAALQLNVYDKDLLSSNDYVGGTTLDMTEMIEKTLYNEYRQSYDSESEITELTLHTPNQEKELKKPIKLKVSIQCLTIKEAEMSPAGIGRGDPNQDPYLEQPKGRFKWTLNPISLLEQLVGPSFRDKACMILCSIFCLLMLVLIVPLFFSDFLTRRFEGLIGIR